MDDLINDFISEAREMLQALEVELVAWEREPADRARLDVIFRFFHTVKGNCGFFDLPRLEALSHAAEDVLAAVRGGERVPDSALVDAVLAIIDRISAMIEALDAGEDMPPADDEAALVAALFGSSAEDGSSEPAEAASVVPSSQAKKENTRQATARTVRLPVELLDRVMNGVSDMILARNEVERHIFDKVSDQELETSFKRLSGILSDLQGTITQARMQPIGTLFSTYQRLVRDLSQETGKQAVLQIESGEVELDREMIDLIRDPLMHVIRNAIDHGIESPKERLAIGKPPMGEIRVSARQTGNVIRIGVMDDGRGIDCDRLVQKAIAAGVITAEAAEQLSIEERAALICEPGLSTAREVTQLSGRGVGMDAVRAAIERVGGSLSITTTLGAGTRILLNVPLTLSIVPSISVSIAGQTFLIPHSYVDEIVRAGDELESESLGGLRQVMIRGRQRACVGLADVLGVKGAAAERDQTLVMLRLINGDVVGLGVDRVLDHDELVIKPVAPEILATKFYVGVAQLDDGLPALMLDIAGVTRAAGLITDVQARLQVAHSDAANSGENEHTVPVIVFDAIDGGRRAVAMSIVERMFEFDVASVGRAGSAWHLVHEGAIVPLAGVPEGWEPAGGLFALMLSDGERRIAHAATGEVDLGEIDRASTAGAPGERVALVEGQSVELVDSHALFAALAVREPVARQATCRLPLDDAWSREFLRPMVEAAGYLAIDDANAAVDLEIRLDGDDRETEAAAAQLLWISEQQVARKGAIYRYDRDSLAQALEAARVRRSA